MSKPEKKYVVMRASGAIMRLGSGVGGSIESTGSYLAILQTIAQEMNSAGGNYDRPDKLFLNGKLVVDAKLSDLAWEYDRDMRAATAAASSEVKNIHTPPWRPDDEASPGYNPPGIDLWTVRKNTR